MNQYPESTISVAKDLRSHGYTYREICDLLKEKIPKSTLSSWFKKIILPNEYYQRMKLLGFTNIKLAQEHNKVQLNSRLKNLRIKNVNLIKSIDISVGKIILAVLYWCEGNKYPASRGLKFGNSDPKMIKLFLALLRYCYHIDEEKLRLTIQCRSDQDPAALTLFWTEITQIPQSKHYHPRSDKRSIGKSTQKTNYMGVCVIDYFDSNLQCELQFFGEQLGNDQYIEQVKNQIK